MTEKARVTRRTIHMCQSVRGALKNWSDSEWRALALHNNCTVKECKEEFLQYLSEGKEVIPFGEPCEGFDYKDGCPGHDKTDKFLSDIELK